MGKKLNLRPAGSLSTWARKYRNAHLAHALAQSKGDTKTVDQVSVEVPCGDCSACCRDVPASLAPHEVHRYKTHLEPNPVDGAPRLATQEDGSCVYLIDGKCSIYDHRPVMCRLYDCRVYAACGVYLTQNVPLAQVSAEWEFVVKSNEDLAVYLSLIGATGWCVKRYDCDGEHAGRIAGASHEQFLPMARRFVNKLTPLQRRNMLKNRKSDLEELRKHALELVGAESEEERQQVLRKQERENAEVGEQYEAYLETHGDELFREAEAILSR